MKETETKGEEEKTGPGGRDQVGRLRERRVGSDSRGRAHISAISNAHMAVLVCCSFLQGYGNY